MADEPALSKGQSSEWVTYLQQLLAYAGYWNGGETGEFDDALEEAVKQYQSAAGLTADGQVGPATWNALTGASSSSSSTPEQQQQGEHLITIPADILAGVQVETYPELVALMNASDFDDYLRNYVGIDPSVFSENDPENVA